jgi:7-keto-8-aminopelargonate synthetase-like enzyme
MYTEAEHPIYEKNQKMDAFTQDLFELSGNTRDFKDPVGPALLERTGGFFAWQQARNSSGFWPYSRCLESAPKGQVKIQDSRGLPQQGVNFASQDYLSLATNAAVKDAAIEAIHEYGVHSAGSAAVLGNTNLSLQLERELADFLCAEHVTLFPTGWAAGYGVSKGLVRRDDYILMDMLSHTCLQEGACAATPKVSMYRHLDHEHAKSMLARIRKQDKKNAILVITEGLFSMDSDSPDIAEFQRICDQYEATLVVDVAHDLGAMGPGGTGSLGLQNMLGKVDLVMGSFSKSFGSNGGFVASRHASVKQFLKAFSPSQTFSNALSPSQSAVVLKTTDIIRSAQGDTLRTALMANIIALRGNLKGNGLTVMGAPSPIVPVLIGREDQARIAASLLPEYGVLTNLAEYPAVPQEMARFRLQVMANHTLDETETAGQGVAKAIAAAQTCRP